MMVVNNLMGHVAERIRGRRVLYVGVGDLQGGISINVRRIQQSASEWHAIDFDPRLSRENPDLNIILQDLNHPILTPLPQVDFVVMTEVLEHLRSPVETLRNIGQRLPGARLIGSVPNALSLGRIVSALWSPRFYAGNDGNHLLVFNQCTLRRTLAEAGLTAVDICVYDMHRLARPFMRWRPDFARGLYFEGSFPNG